MEQTSKMKLDWKTIIPICLLLPLLSFVFLRPEWLARLVAAALFGSIAGISVLILALHPTLAFRSKTGKAVGYYWSKQPESERRKAVLFARVLLLAFGLFLLYCCAKPTVYDSIQIARFGKSYLMQVRGRVVSNSSPAGMYFLHQGLSVEIGKGEPDKNCNAVFLPRRANIGQTYAFLIAPESAQVLSFDPTDSDGNPPSNKKSEGNRQ